MNDEFKKGSNLKDFYKSGKGDALGWALIFFWGAFVYLMDITGTSSDVSWWNGWSVFVTVFGLIVLTNAVMHLVVKQHGKGFSGFIFGSILILIGLGGVVDTRWAWFLFFVIVGVLILTSVFIPKK